MKGYKKIKIFLFENEFKHKDVDKTLGINKTLFSKKINMNGTKFNIEEIKKMCIEFNLNANEYFLI